MAQRAIYRGLKDTIFGRMDVLCGSAGKIGVKAGDIISIINTDGGSPVWITAIEGNAPAFGVGAFGLPKALEIALDPANHDKSDQEIIALFAQKFGFHDRFFRNIALEEDGLTPDAEDTLREINRGMWTIGYTGQSPERLKMHMANQHTFDKTTLQAVGGAAGSAGRGPSA